MNNNIPHYLQEISSKPRPFLAHEHPTFLDQIKAFSKRLALVRYIKLPYKSKIVESSLLVDVNKILSITNSTNNVSTIGKDTNFLHQHTIGLTHYLLDAYLNHYISQDHTHAYYSGWHGEQGIASDAKEGVARNVPLIASYLVHVHQLLQLSQSEREQQALFGWEDTPINRQRYQDLLVSLTATFKNITDPQHPGYWGELTDYSQVICETHDIALALWISRDLIFNQYPLSVQQQILSWLRNISKVQTVDNNWHLFVVLTELVVADLAQRLATRLGYCTDIVDGYHTNAEFYASIISLERYQRIKEFYSGAGWFRDGAKGDYDYYNSWGFHYSLYWINQIDPHFDSEFITSASTRLAQDLIYLFSPKGVAFFGRSLPYRFACCTGLVVADLLQHQATGSHIRAILQNNNFIAHGALNHGTLTQGLYHADRRLIDPYSGPASVFWSTRPYVLLLYQGTAVNYWATDAKPLPVELGDYQYQVPEIGLTISGTQDTQEVVAHFVHSKYKFNSQTSKLEDQSCWLKLKEFILGRSTRGKNNLLRKGVTTYSSQFNLYL